MLRKWIIISGLLLIAIACNNTGKNNTPKMKMDKKNSNQATGQSASGKYYTCPMHHQIRSDKPGKCPICGMTLVPVTNDQPDMDSMQNKRGKDTVAQIVLQPREQQLAGIRIDTARRTPLAGQIVLTGTTMFDPQHQDVISAWVSGWIEKMYVRNPGEEITAGQKLYELYSPDLLSAEKDYLLALKQKELFKKASVDLPTGQADFTAALEAMKQKLLRWGLTGSQIKQLPQQQPVGRVTIYSKTSGYVIQKMKEEGGYVREGEAILSLAGNRMLWVQAQLYDTELPLLSENPNIWVELEAYPGQRLSGKVVFNNPVNQNDSRVHLLNIAIPNPDGKIQPGMLAYVYLQTSAGTPVLAIPKSSVIYDKKNNYVWTALPGNRFERHRVQLGTDNHDMIEIMRGIKPGEQVVSSGAYLVNSEYVLQYGSGVNMAGMSMSDMKMKGRGK